MRGENFLDSFSEWLIVALVGESQHLLVATAVAKCLDVVSGSVEAEG